MLRPAIMALIRQALTVVGVVLVTNGYIEAAELESIIGAIMTLGSTIWSVIDKRNTAKVIAATPPTTPVE